MTEAPANFVPPKFPAALIAIAPGGSFGAERRSLVEVKAAISSIVVPLEPGAVLLTSNEFENIDSFDHLTIHDNLMVHLQGPSGPRSLVAAGWNGVKLMDDAIHLASISAAPQGVSAKAQGRFQKRYEGGVPVLPFVPDSQYDPLKSHLVVDIWASIPTFGAPAWLPPILPNCRIALDFDGKAALGPVPPEWVFRNGDVPKCVFHFRFWYCDMNLPGPFVKAGGLCFKVLSATNGGSAS